MPPDAAAETSFITWDEKAAIQEICTASSLNAATAAYLAHRRELPGWRFILDSPNGNEPGQAVSKRFSDTAAVLTFFDRVIVLDERTVADMANYRPFGIDHSIALDTNAVSQLPLMSETSFGGTPAFQAAMQYIVEINANCDPMPYLQENYGMIVRGKKEELDLVFKTLKAYTKLKHLDLDIYRTSGRLVFECGPEEIERETQSALSSFLLGTGDKRIEAEMNAMHGQLYCLLLAMAKAQFNRNKQANKSLLLAEFMDKKLCTIFHRELAVGRELFTKGDKSPFFTKVQKKKSDLFKHLKNMAWDLMHVRLTEQNFTHRPQNGARYYFPGFLTLDGGLISLVDAYPLRALAISPTGLPFAFFRGRVADLLGGRTPEETQELENRFFSQEAAMRRQQKREGVNIPELIAELEDEVTDLGEIPKTLETA